MTLQCDGVRCGKCLNDENCSCLMEWPDNDDKDLEKYYYNDYQSHQILFSKSKTGDQINLDDFNIEE